MRESRVHGSGCWRRAVLPACGASSLRITIERGEAARFRGRADDMGISTVDRDCTTAGRSGRRSAARTGWGQGIPGWAGCNRAGCTRTGRSPAGCAPAGRSPGVRSPPGRTLAVWVPAGRTRNQAERDRVGCTRTAYSLVGRSRAEHARTVRKRAEEFPVGRVNRVCRVGCRGRAGRH